MSGVKGRSGGARLGSGPHRRRVRLDAEYARKLASLTKQRKASEDEVITQLIDQALEPREIQEREQKLRQIIDELFALAAPGDVKNSLWRAYQDISQE
jgi:hypothetical protein